MCKFRKKFFRKKKKKSVHRLSAHETTVKKKKVFLDYSVQSPQMIRIVVILSSEWRMSLSVLTKI